MALWLSGCIYFYCYRSNWDSKLKKRLVFPNLTLVTQRFIRFFGRHAMPVSVFKCTSVYFCSWSCGCLRCLSGYASLLPANKSKSAILALTYPSALLIVIFSVISGFQRQNSARQKSTAKSSVCNVMWSRVSICDVASLKGPVLLQDWGFRWSCQAEKWEKEIYQLHILS